MSWLYAVLCMLGMVTHVSIITREYLKYTVSNTVMMDLQMSVDMPALSVCWRYADLMDIDRLNVDHKLNLTPIDIIDYSTNLPKLEAIERKVTLHQVFNYTPPGENHRYHCVAFEADNINILEYSIDRYRIDDEFQLNSEQ